ncbi:hypothetical protein HCU01_36960 [Halomonas cupida]|uniref:Pilus assembly protein, PilP n=1 Tax=Halomonas cupida TaxID=44933 RepID=A0A1M7MAR1_9GAMM|nr:pilus assembly protein PilP [Halomonas cupida]GEN25747.1 hypothetical protein HCU01_36960 [Halomonas cupida]SHM87906.1 Pilus assembly protein, PilP [Halomonas cupida]
MSAGWRYWCGLLCSVMMLTGCGDAELERLDAQLAALVDQSSVREPRQVVGTSLDHLPVHDPLAIGRSPFRADGDSRLLEMSSLAFPGSALSQYELDQLELQGTLARGDRYWALVAAPDGHLHRLGVNQRLGQRGWKVVAIDGESMSIVAQGATGEQVAERQIMRLGASRGDG